MVVKRILGLDLALHKTGWVVFDHEANAPITGGVITTPARRKTEPILVWNQRRYEHIVRAASLIAVEHDVQLVAFEYPDYVRSKWSGGTMGRESSSMFGLGVAFGFMVAWSLNAKQSLRFTAISTSAAKSNLTGSKSANKGRISLTCLDHWPNFWHSNEWPSDVYDAVAVAAAAAAEL